MGLFGLFKKKSDETKVGNVEDFISLTRVYFQSVIATNLGITNIRFLPDVANFKRLFKVPTQNGKLGLAEKSAARKMLMQDYGLNENFFKEIDSSVKRNCRTQNDIQSYLFMYQGFSNDLMMLMGNLMQWKFRMPSIFKKALYSGFFAYWVVCLPLGCFLDFVMEHGPAAYWQSLDIGLFFSAVFLTLRMFWLQKKLAREQI